METISGTAFNLTSAGPSLTKVQFVNNQFSDVVTNFIYYCSTPGATNCLRVTGNSLTGDLDFDNSMGSTLQIEIPSTNYEQMSFNGSVVFVPEGTCE